jgi:excalibur calcium-binding domain-containing protein
MKNLPSRWKYGLITALAIVGISSASASHPPDTQPKTTHSAIVDEQIKGAQASVIAPTATLTPIPSKINTVRPTDSPLIRAIIPTQTTVEQSSSVYSDEDKDCSDFSTHAQAQAFFEAAGSGDPHRLDRDGDGIACEDLP